jgi:hypothetical protein
MAESKCRDLFTGIESMDVDFIEAHSKRQNVKGAAGLLDDVAYAQSLGIMVAYGYLFDPRMTSVARMKNELRAVLQNDQLHHPYFVAFVAPLAGTALFWQAVDSGELLPGLRLRDLDGRCIAYRSTVDDTETLSAFASTIFRTPQIYSDWRKTLRRFARDFLQHGWKSPMRSMLFFRNRLRLAHASGASIPRRSPATTSAGAMCSIRNTGTIRPTSPPPTRRATSSRSP